MRISPKGSTGSKEGLVPASEHTDFMKPKNYPVHQATIAAPIRTVPWRYQINYTVIAVTCSNLRPY
jgi:hypothetical protein